MNEFIKYIKTNWKIVAAVIIIMLACAVTILVLANPNTSACEPGYEEKDSGCVACKAGTYSSGRKCLPCREGSYSKEAMGYCNLCMKGESSSVPGATKCEPCATGYYSNVEGSVKCRKCPKGRYSDGMRCT